LSTQADLVVEYLGVDAGPLPLRFRFGEAATLSACVEEAAAVLGEAIANAAALAGSGQAGRAWQAAFADGVALAPRAGATLVGLELSPADAGDAVAVSLHFDRTLLDDGCARQWLAAWHNLLDAMLASPQAPIDGPDLLDATQARAPLERDAAAAVAFPPVAAVHRLFEAQAAHTPGATALVHGDRRLDYAALNARANRLARHLRALGVGADERVAIYVDRGMEVVLGLLAVLKAGGAYVPLDPTYPAERLAYTLADSAPRVLLTMSGMEHGAREVLGELPAALAVVDLVADEADWQALDPRDLDDGECPVDAGHLAYVLYTSGSTGQPKGVAMPHGPLVNLVQWQLRQPGNDLPLRTLQYAALGFDVAFQETLATLANGGELHLIDQDTRLSAGKLFEFIVEHRIERMFLPYFALQMLAEGLDGHLATLPD